MQSDTIMEYSIPAQWTTLWDNRTYTGWLVKAKDPDIGWFRSTDNKWATQSQTITIQNNNNYGKSK